MEHQTTDATDRQVGAIYRLAVRCHGGAVHKSVAIKRAEQILPATGRAALHYALLRLELKALEDAA